MQFDQHQSDCNQLQHNSVSVLFLISLVFFPSKIRQFTKCHYFPGSNRQSRISGSLYYPLRGTLPVAFRTVSLATFMYRFPLLYFL